MRRVLAAAPEVHLLTTSREPLGIDDERVRRVESLAVPDHDAPLEVAASSPSVQLFAGRAGSVDEGFVLDGANVQAVVDVCRRLDGIPLAIELAAALTRALSPTEISARLGRRFELFGGGSSRPQDRQRTLLATVSWSYDLLSVDEKAVFQRLAVFPASFDLAAAEAVAAAGGVDVVGCMVRLVDRSLVQYERDRGRYRLLETLRQYAADRLGDSGETGEARSRHAQHFDELTARIYPRFFDARYLGAVSALTAEIDNLRAVAEWYEATSR